MENEEKKGMNPMIIGLVVIAIVAVLAVGVIAMQSSNKGTTTTTTSTSPAMVSESPSPEAMQKTYKDGTYTVVGNYTSPGGPEELGVEVTLVNNVIADVEVEVKAERPMSVKMQEDFAANYKTLVVGKSIDEVNLGKVSGSSLSPKGFNDALEKIKAEATT